MPPEHLSRLVRPAARPRPGLGLGPGVALAGGRAHELCGPSRIVLAAMLAGAAEGPVLWIRPSWAEGRLNPDGLQRFIDPARLVMALPARAEDVLWTLEEALRSGAVAVAVAEPTAPPALTPVRRLHLAAEAGTGDGRAPVGLLLGPGGGGAQGVETRWRMAPLPGWARGPSGRPGPEPGPPAWRLELLRARAQRPQAWELRWQAGRPRLGPLPGAAPARADAPADAIA